VNENLRSRGPAPGYRGEGLLLASRVRGLHGRPGFGRGDRGATATEYAIMVSLIAVVIIAGVTLFGQNMIHLFQVPSSAL
jgi:Flp pilus assembly pilin Flp